MEFIWGWNIFQKFLNKLMQRERDFGGPKYFFENFIPSPPSLESQLSPDQRRFCSAPSLINRLTHPQHTPWPTRTKRQSALRMKMRLNQDVGGDNKKCAIIGVRQSLSSAIISWFAITVRKVIFFRWVIITPFVIVLIT